MFFSKRKQELLGGDARTLWFLSKMLMGKLRKVNHCTIRYYPYNILVKKKMECVDVYWTHPDCVGIRNEIEGCFLHFCYTHSLRDAGVTLFYFSCDKWDDYSYFLSRKWAKPILELVDTCAELFGTQTNDSVSVNGLYDGHVQILKRRYEKIAVHINDLYKNHNYKKLFTDDLPTLIRAYEEASPAFQLDAKKELDDFFASVEQKLTVDEQLVEKEKERLFYRQLFLSKKRQDLE